MTELHKQVAKVVQVAKNRNTKQVINDLMQMYCNLLTEPAFIEVAFPQTLYAYNEGFRQELSYYKTDLPAWHELQTLGQMFMQAIAKGEPFQDHIGSLYDLQLAGNSLGQFLTPPDVADMLGEVLMANSPPIEAPITIGDTTGCGAGTLILSQVKAILNRQGRGAMRFLDVRAVDLDIFMVKMTAVQVVLNSCIHRIPLHSFTVQHGNAITDYTAMNEGKLIAFHWSPNVPLGSYFEARREHMRHHDKALQALETITELTKEIETEMA